MTDLHRLPLPQHQRQRRAAPAAATVAEIAWGEVLGPVHQRQRPAHQQPGHTSTTLGQQGLDAAGLEAALPAVDGGRRTEQHRGDARPGMPVGQQEDDVRSQPNLGGMVLLPAVDSQKPLAFGGAQDNTAVHGSVSKVVRFSNHNSGPSHFLFQAELFR